MEGVSGCPKSPFRPCPPCCAVGNHLTALRGSKVPPDQLSRLRAATSPRVIGQRWPRAFRIANGVEGAGRGKGSPEAYCTFSWKSLPAKRSWWLGASERLESLLEEKEKGTDQKSRTGTSGDLAALGDREVRSLAAAGTQKQTRRPRGWWGGVAIRARKQTRACLWE